MNSMIKRKLFAFSLRLCFLTTHTACSPTKKLPGDSATLTMAGKVLLAAALAATALAAPLLEERQNCGSVW